MKQLEYELLKMRHARAVANIYQYAASANRESTLDGWRCDWEGAMREANAEAVKVEHEITCVINGVTAEELAKSDRDHKDAATPSN
jgi:hypothetical protein